MAGALLGFDEALQRVVDLGAFPEAEPVPIRQALGRRLAANVTARLTQPPADLSAMDGYAVRFSDLPGPLKMVGESAAGHKFHGNVGPHEAVRIFTGAYVPVGADCVAIQEDAEVSGSFVGFPNDRPANMGANIRRRGLDFSEGQNLGGVGVAVSAAMLGLLAAAGLAELPVFRMPRVAILSTGDELVAPGSTPGDGQIVGSNGLMIASLLQEAGAIVEDLGIVADTREALQGAIQKAAGADILVTIGGASVGDHDLVKPVLESMGARLDFWRVAIRPGKPLMAGTLGPQTVIGLPGNPVSAFVCARLFLVPLIRRMGGNSTPFDQPIQARLSVPLPANGARRHFQRARLENGEIIPARGQDSSLLSTLSWANALLIQKENTPALEIGAIVDVLSL